MTKCDLMFPERGHCKICDEYFAYHLDNDPRGQERREHLYRDVELKTLRIAMAQIRQIVKDVIGEEIEL